MIKVTKIKIAEFMKLTKAKMFPPSTSTLISENLQSFSRLSRRLDEINDEIRVEIEKQLRDKRPIDQVNEHRDDFT